MRLGRYVVKRLLLLVPVMLVVLCVSFVLTHMMPANPVYHMAGPVPDPVVVEALTKEMGLDKPLPVQFLIYIKRLVSGDWGWAWHTGHPVSYDLRIRLTATLELSLVSLLLSILVGVPLGIVAALNANRPIDHAVRVLALLGLSIPEYVMGLLLIYFLYYKLDLFPPQIGRIGLLVPPPDTITGLYIVDSLLTLNWEAFRSSLSYICLPACSLGIAILAPMCRFTRSAMLDVLNSEFILAAKSYGLSSRTIYLKYALKNALFRVATVIGLGFGWLLCGVVLIENIFGWPGMGQYSLQSIEWNDYAAVQGFILVITASYVIVNLVVDLMLAVLDPRVKY